MSRSGGGRLSPTVVKARAVDTRDRLEAQRATNPVVDVAFRSVQLHERAGGGLLAGAIAFRFFLFLVPCVFVLVMGLGLGADAADVDVQEVARRAGIAGVAATAIQSGADASTFTRWCTLVVALVAAIWASRNLIKALLVAHALIWRTDMRKLRHPTRAGLALIGAFALATVLLRCVYALRSVSLVLWIAGVAFYVLVPAAVWLGCSLRLFPVPSGVSWRHLWPGAALFGVGVQALHLVTVFYVTRSIESKSDAYGAIGAALTILFWAYLMGELVTSAAAINAALWRSSLPAADRATAVSPPVGDVTATASGRHS